MGKVPGGLGGYSSSVLISEIPGQDGQNKKPLARLVGIDFNSKKRIAGLNRGEILVSDDFDVPLPDEFWLAEK